MRLGNTTASTDDANVFYERLGAKCGNATTDCPVQSYSYEWDEVGRLTKATRYDGETLGAELTYAYDGSDQRVRKSAGPRHTIYIFGSLELRSAEFTNGAYQLDDRNPEGCRTSWF